MNSINIISPYKHQGMWVFDDERVGLIQEPFVDDADKIINLLVADIPNAADGFRMIFSASAFPGYKYRFTWVRPELSGNVYRSEDLGLEGWVCPALFKYFDEAPKELYADIKPAP